MNKDRYLGGRPDLDTGKITDIYYLINGKAYIEDEALWYLQRNGFTRKEAQEYIRILIDELSREKHIL